ncbi:hypothetical protein I305_00962 [Cryptococcus gattii E566]|nr:hypothetical protein I305_00962 [Cryptococcus gattii E566]
MGNQAINTIQHAAAHINITKGILKTMEKGLMGDKEVEKGVKSSGGGVETTEKHKLVSELLFQPQVKRVLTTS